MKIKITEKNKTEIDKIIKEAEGRATARRMTFGAVQALAEYVEEHLEKNGVPKSERIGSKYTYRESIQCNSYDYPADATGIAMERGSSAWYLISVDRGRTRTARGSRNDYFYPSARAIEAAKKAAVRSLEKI